MIFPWEWHTKCQKAYSYGLVTSVLGSRVGEGLDHLTPFIKEHFGFTIELQK